MPPAFNLSQDQTLQFNLCFFAPSWKGTGLLITLAGIDQALFVAFSIFLCFKPWARDKFALSRLFFETTALQFSLLSPRSRLSVRCLVFKELFVAAVAATRSKFYKTSFRLVKSFSKIFLFSFRSSHFRAIKKSRCSRLIFGFPSNEVANYDRLRLFCQIFFVRFFLFSSEYTLTPCFYSLFSLLSKLKICIPA